MREVSTLAKGPYPEPGFRCPPASPLAAVPAEGQQPSGPGRCPAAWSRRKAVTVRRNAAVVDVDVDGDVAV